MLVLEKAAMLSPTDVKILDKVAELIKQVDVTEKINEYRSLYGKFYKSLDVFILIQDGVA